MKNLDILIEQLKIAKEELNKGVNMSMGGEPNGAMKGEGVSNRVGPAFSDKKDVGNGRMVTGDSPSPAAVESKLMHDMAHKNENDQPPARDADKKKVPMNKGEEAEKCSIDKNGQWKLEKDASNPQFAPKDRKIKELQNKIDLGQYKPKASQVADKILAHPEKPLKKEE